MSTVCKKIEALLSELFLPANRHEVIPFSIVLRAEMQNQNSLANYALEIINDERTPMG